MLPYHGSSDDFSRTAPLLPFIWKVMLKQRTTPSIVVTQSLHVLRAVQVLRSLTLVWCIQHHLGPAAIAHTLTHPVAM